jgi:hypothetical protein
MYSGPLSIKKMSQQARAAYFSWHGQNSRCYDRTDKGYKYYGARGVRQKYSCREFMAWWIKCAGRSKRKFVCDRINPKGNYEFGNIQLISKTENSLRIDRSYMHFSVIWKSPSGDIKFGSVREAAAAAGVTGTCIWKHCNGIRKNKKFSYTEEK